MAKDQPLISRRGFLLGAAGVLGAAALAPWKRRAPSPEITGTIVGPSHKVGHLLRSGAFPKPTKTLRTTVAIAGGGMAGLSAGWKLRRCGITDFKVLDLERDFGGNSRWGQNAVSAYPWGAHYVPFPTAQAKGVSELLRELKVETGRDARGRAVYDERYVCFAPAERLFAHGRWQEGLFPRLGASAEDLRQHDAFDAAMAAFRRLRDEGGRPAFAIPMELSSRRADLLALDRISMAEYLKRNGWDSPRLRWYVEYASRDDFGCVLEDLSAWAGIHYFAARGEGEEDQVLTWPEGNGWIARRLESVVSEQLTPSALAFNIDQDQEGPFVDYLDVENATATRLRAKAVITAMPRFAAAKVVAALRKRPPEHLRAFQYSPWMVANLTVDAPPPGTGAAPAWDNVLYGSDSLGYVSATHQGLSQDQRASVWTYYQPFASGAPSKNRRMVYERSWEDWRELVLKDLSRPHPDIRKHVRHLDVMVWGHGMIQPRVGFVWGGAREEAARPIGDIFFGHSDLSGLSIFEEAQYRGLKAAEDVMARLGHPFRSSI